MYAMAPSPRRAATRRNARRSRARRTTPDRTGATMTAGALASAMHSEPVPGVMTMARLSRHGQVNVGREASISA